MAVSLTQTANSNLLDLSTWTTGSGGCTGFTQNGDTAENERVNATGPYGASVVVWECRPTGGSNADGGWESSYKSIDKTKLYRYSVWARRTSSTSGGTFYFGLHTDGTGDTIPLATGGTQTNPYWDYRGTSFFTQNVWYLVVGHIYPNGTAQTTANPNSGIYTQAAGKVSPLQGNIPYDCSFPSNATTAMNRTYLYYCSDTTVRMQYFSPRIDLVDGTEPSISTLLSQNLVTSSTVPGGVKFSDNTYQTTTFQNSTTAAPLNTGSLLGIFPYNIAGSYTWTKPSGCTKVFVRVVGGGGGAAGYTESGGGGGYSENYVDLTGVSSVTVTVGAGGAGVHYYAAAGSGGTSSFGSYASATGGSGANANYSHTGGAGGVGSLGTINLYGGDGTGHSDSSGHYPGGCGGSTFWGGGGTENRSSTMEKLYPGAPGTGGPGGRTNDGVAGTVGEVGLVVIYAYR